jgi:hypothetical protein
MGHALVEAARYPQQYDQLGMQENPEFFTQAT